MSRESVVCLLFISRGWVCNWEYRRRALCTNFEQCWGAKQWTKLILEITSIARWNGPKNRKKEGENYIFFAMEARLLFFSSFRCETDSLAYVRICVTHFWSTSSRIFVVLFRVLAVEALWSVNGRSTVSLLLCSYFILFNAFFFHILCSLSSPSPSELVQTSLQTSSTSTSMDWLNCASHNTYYRLLRTVCVLFEWFYVLKKARKAIISC